MLKLIDQFFYHFYSGLFYNCCTLFFYGPPVLQVDLGLYFVICLQTFPLLFLSFSPVTLLRAPGNYRGDGAMGGRINPGKGTRAQLFTAQHTHL
jgi:hypothetical protein